MADIAIRDATLIDGTGQSAIVGDLGIDGDRIVSVGSAQSALLEINAKGLVCAPGFIDIHAHSDYTLIADGRGASALLQGVSTHICGNCGISAFPAGPMGLYWGVFESKRLRKLLRPEWASASGYFNALETKGIGLNTAFFVGHGAVRHCVMGESIEVPNMSQMAEMKALVKQQMEEGAYGLSTGLTYVPGSFASTDEITELVSVTSPYDGIYATHMRNYSASIMEALDESIKIGQRALVPVHVSHITPCPPKTGIASHLLDRINEARGEGMDVTADTEFYSTGSTTMKALLPPDVLVGGNDQMIEALSQPELRKRMWREIEARGSELGGSTKTVLMQKKQWDKLWLGNCANNTKLIGKSFAEIGKIRGVHPFEAMCDILVEEQGVASFFGEDKTYEDIDTLAKGQHCGLGSDGFALANDGPLADEREHPRCYGGIANLIRTMVYDRGVLSLEKLVQRITEFPAKRMRFSDRGIIAEGRIADVVVFDPQQLSDNATIDYPNRYSEGVIWLFVNGTAVVAEGELTGELPGRVLKRNVSQ